MHIGSQITSITPYKKTLDVLYKIIKLSKITKKFEQNYNLSKKTFKNITKLSCLIFF